MQTYIQKKIDGKWRTVLTTNSVNPSSILDHLCKQHCRAIYRNSLSKTDDMPIGIGAEAYKSKKDLCVTGVVRRIEEATYDYADIKDEKYNSMLTIPLLQFEGKRVEVTINVI